MWVTDYAVFIQDKSGTQPGEYKVRMKIGHPSEANEADNIFMLTVRVAY